MRRDGDIGGYLQRYLRSLPLPDRPLTHADAEDGQRAKQALIESGDAAVPLLLDRLMEPDFVVKDACYDLLLEIGSVAQVALRNERGCRGPIIDIWIAAILQKSGDATAFDRIESGLHDSSEEVRHLTALALAFHRMQSGQPPSEELVSVLVESLSDERTIENTPFTVAGSALACLTDLAGEDFLGRPKTFRLYNYEGFLYPPPLHPFPFAEDVMRAATDAEKEAIRNRAIAWRERRKARQR